MKTCHAEKNELNSTKNTSNLERKNDKDLGFFAMKANKGNILLNGNTKISEFLTSKLKALV